MISIASPLGWLGMYLVAPLLANTRYADTPRESFLCLWAICSILGYVQWLVIVPVLGKQFFQRLRRTA